jgi:hypothetical protein
VRWSSSFVSLCARKCLWNLRPKCVCVCTNAQPKDYRYISEFIWYKFQYVVETWWIYTRRFMEEYTKTLRTK